jgi:AraC family transcriptional regulator
LNIRMNAGAAVLQPGAFYGSLEPVHDAERLRLITSRHAPCEELPPHVHLSAYLSFVLRGQYAENAWGAVIARDTFTLRFHPAGEEHRDRFGPTGALCLNIQLLGGWDETVERLGLTRGVRTFDAAAPRILDVYRRHQAHDVEGALVLEEAALEFLAQCAVREQQDGIVGGSVPLRRAIEYIHDSLPKSIVLTAVAAAARVHPTHLARLFKTRLGCTLSSFVRARRLELAQRTLAARPEWHLSRVALEHGFADHAHFTRSFQRDFRMSPSSFRSLLTAY